MKKKLNEFQQGVIGSMLSVNPVGRLLELAGITDVVLDEQLVQEDTTANSINQMLTSADSLPQFGGNKEAARLYVIGGILSAIYANLKEMPFQSTQAQDKMKSLNLLGAMGADLIKTSQVLSTASKVANTTPGAPTPGTT